MLDTLTALASENLNPSLRSLLEDVQRGHIRIPRFQRPFVWSDTQRLELLESIRDNMPIGSLLVWRTVKHQLASFTSIGPHQIPPIAEDAPTSGWQYLLDGHQRVSTLLGLLLQPTAQQLNIFDSIDWDIEYDLMDQAFVFGTRARRETVKRPLLPLWTLFDGRLVNRYMRELRRRENIENWTDANFDEWEVRADQLSYRFQQCRVPVVVMVSDDLQLAAKTFQRVNSLGTPMGEAHLVAALTWKPDFDLREQLDAVRSGFPVGWRKLDDDIFLQVCKGLSGLDITKAGQTELVKQLVERPRLLMDAAERLKLVANWLSDSAAVVGPELLPYALQAVLLALSVEQSSATPFPPACMSWFWRTSWSEAFASSSFRQVRIEQDLLRAALEGAHVSPRVQVEPLPDRFDFRSARVRLFMLRLAARPGLVDANGAPLNGRELLMRHGRDALARIFSAPRNASPRLRRLLQGPGNRFFIDPSTDAVLKERLRYGPDLPGEALAAHFVSGRALNSLRAGNLEEFIESRAAAMNEWDRQQLLYETRDGNDSTERCSIASAEHDLARARELVGSPFPALRAQAYELVRTHARCENKDIFVSLLIQKANGDLGPNTDNDLMEILRFWELASTWRLAPQVGAHWENEGATFSGELNSAFRSFFLQYLYERPSEAIQLISSRLLILSKNGKPDVPTSHFLWILAHATEQTRLRLGESELEQLLAVARAYWTDDGRFPALEKIRAAVMD